MSLWRLLCGSMLLLNLAPGVCGAQQAYDLTGIWADDVGGHYRIRQAGNTLAWYDDRSPVATNVFTGAINGNTIDGQWWDIPGGQLLGFGRLSLRIDSNDRLVKTGSSPDYGGTVITRVAGGATASGAAACTPAGTWNWVDNATAVINADGTVTHTSGYTARWQRLGGNQYLFTWNNGAIDTLTLSSDGRAMDGTNNYGRAIHVTCAKSGGGTPASTGGTRAGGICADPRTQAVMDQWLSRANPPDNTRPGWNVHYDSWGRLVGRTPSTTLTGLPQGIDTKLTRCEYLWSIAASLNSTNLGTLRDYLHNRLR
jgi:hypothetical protein